MYVPNPAPMTITTRQRSGRLSTASHAWLAEAWLSDTSSVSSSASDTPMDSSSASDVEETEPRVTAATAATNTTAPAPVHLPRSKRKAVTSRAMAQPEANSVHWQHVALEVERARARQSALLANVDDSLIDAVSLSSCDSLHDAVDADADAERNALSEAEADEDRSAVAATNVARGGSSGNATNNHTDGDSSEDMDALGPVDPALRIGERFGSPWKQVEVGKFRIFSKVCMGLTRVLCARCSNTHDSRP